MSISPEQRERYYASLNERRLVITPRRPRFEWMLPSVAGLGIGYGGSGLVTGHPDYGWVALIVGLILAAAWWFGIASDSACGRRYERARLAAIRQRLCEVGVSEADAKAATR